MGEVNNIWKRFSCELEGVERESERVRGGKDMEDTYRQRHTHDGEWETQGRRERDGKGERDKGTGREVDGHRDVHRQRETRSRRESTRDVGREDGGGSERDGLGGGGVGRSGSTDSRTWRVSERSIKIESE